ncbi:MAG: DUF2284 domain-containing protein [Candidatus Izemoplasmatales bacterium]|nr:DUF2284 domain-containing protein [Candidatus Izemoplasmatales bacterium]
MEDEITQFLEQKQITYSIINPKDIIFRDEFTDRCKMNYCGRYNTSWTCPPAIGDISELRKRVISYPKAILYQMIFPLEDNYDVEGMDEGRHCIMKVTLELHQLLQHQNSPFLVLAAGSCSICPICTYPDKECRHPELKLYSMESLGIDVAVLSKMYQLKYYNGPCTVTYYSVVFFSEEKCQL